MKYFWATNPLVTLVSLYYTYINEGNVSVGNNYSTIQAICNGFYLRTELVFWNMYSLQEFLCFEKSIVCREFKPVNTN